MPSFQFQLLKNYFRIKRFFSPPTGELDVPKERAEMEALAANFKPLCRFNHSPVVANGVPAEWIVPADLSSQMVLLYLHGGSYNAGSINSHRVLAANIAAVARARALIIDYRLAPEHPFPAALEDAATAYLWLLDNTYTPEQIFLAGDSAGGGLTLSLLLYLRDNEKPLPAAAVCLSPWTDLAASGESWRAKAKTDLILDAGNLLKSARVYLGEIDARSPYASPLFADLRGLPPLLIQVGSDELLLSDSVDLAEKAKIAGVSVTLDVWESMGHVWQYAASFLPEGRRAITQIGKFIEQYGLR